MAISQEMRQQVIEKLQQGMSSAEIADELGIGKMQIAGIKAHMTIKGKFRDITSFVQPQTKVSTEPTPSLQTQIAANPGIWARTLPPEDLSPDKAKTSILIGTDLIFNKKVYWDINPDTGSVNPHALIVGETGFGKTYAIQCIITELQKIGLSTIIFDYGQGFGLGEASKEFVDIVKPSQIEASSKGVSINPLQIFPDDMMGPVNVAQRTADTFCRIYPSMGIQQKEAIVEAVEAAFIQAGISMDDKSTWNKPSPSFERVHDRLRDIAETDKHPLRNYARTAYSHIRSFFRFRVIRDGGEKLTWGSMATRNGKCWVIQLKGIERHVSTITTELLLWNLICYLQSCGPSPLKFFVVLDEAHRLSFDVGGPVEWLVREGRKFGVGVILSSQQLADYSQVAISNTATKLVFQNHDDRHLLSKSLAKKCQNISDDRQISRLITTLKRGTAFLLYSNTGRLMAIDQLSRR